MLTLQSRLRPNEEEVAGKVMDGGGDHHQPLQRDLLQHG